jgi:uncharacterized membrane protein YuzA (DUF378 family)
MLMVFSAILVIYNCTQIDYNDLFGKESIVAVITVVAGLCAILILAILLTSKKIQKTIKSKRNN